MKPQNSYRNIGGKLLDIGLGNDFGGMTLRAQATKAKIKKWDYIKLKLHLHSKRNSQQNEKVTYGMGKCISKLSI